ncbi:MAG: hypothetical protein RIR69_1425, partial [Actinomycetota bacterium]
MKELFTDETRWTLLNEGCDTLFEIPCAKQWQKLKKDVMNV